MGKQKNENKRKGEICEYIFDDYIFNKDLTSLDEFMKNIKLLIDNEYALKISGSDDVYDDVSTYKVASMFMVKHNKDLKNHRRRPKSYEIGGSMKCADDDKRLIKLTENSLDEGLYFAILEDYQYAAFHVSTPENDRYSINYELYIIGDKKNKWKDKFFKFYQKFEKVSDEVKKQRIFYTDSRYAKEVKFKPFDQLIFSGKDEIIKYIDNFINNIPKFYSYGMTPKLSILLYGKPGTGKSTFYKALADYMDIKEVSCITPDYFSDGDDNGGRGGRRGYLRETIFAIDDIDCICSSREENSDLDNAKVLSNLLAFLDNPGTFYFKAKDGLYYPIAVVVATTNYYDKLDDAVKRYGRFDLKIEMEDFTKHEAEDMCSLYGLSLSDVWSDELKDGERISPAQLQAKCLENIDQAIKKVE